MIRQAKQPLDILISESIMRAVIDTQGKFFQSLCKLAPEKIASDLLNPLKAEDQARIIELYTPLTTKKVLEIGSGLGVNHVVWVKTRKIDGWCIEPDSEGFMSSLSLSRQLLKANGLDPSRIVNAVGESLPFADETFDIVYSTNALEHTTDPQTTLAEALRVLKPDGFLQFVYPNFRSFFDGHYAVFHPPVLWRSFFPWYIRTVKRRNSNFANTLRTELCVQWTRKALEKLQNNYRFKIISLGQDIFMDRMRELTVREWGGLGRIKRVINTLGKLNINILAANVLVAAQAWTPIILTVQKSASHHHLEGHE